MSASKRIRSALIWLKQFISIPGTVDDIKAWKRIISGIPATVLLVEEKVRLWIAGWVMDRAAAIAFVDSVLYWFALVVLLGLVAPTIFNVLRKWRKAKSPSSTKTETRPSVEIAPPKSTSSAPSPKTRFDEMVPRLQEVSSQCRKDSEGAPDRLAALKGELSKLGIQMPEPQFVQASLDRIVYLIEYASAGDIEAARRWKGEMTEESHGGVVASAYVKAKRLTLG